MNYTSKLLVENYLKRELTENEEAFLMVINPAIKRYIDNHTSSRFDKVDPSSQDFEVDGGDVDLTPCTDITNVSGFTSDRTLDRTYETTEYQAYPLNERVKRELCRTYGYVWYPYRGVVRVTARFSEWDGGVPEDITMVATLMAASLMGNSQVDTDGTTIKSESIEGHTITYGDATESVSAFAENNPAVQGILNQRKELLIG